MIEYVPAKNIVIKNKSSVWFGADYNMNIYRGCPHGCIYCDSRSDCYHVGDFDRVRAKENALEIIRNDLRRKVRSGIIATGSMSDPYNPFEKKLELSRHALELINAYEFGVAIATKSPLITRDIDVLQEISASAPVITKITITTVDDEISRKIEPHVAVSSERLKAVEELSKKGIYAGVLLMPVLPWIADDPEKVRELIRRIADTGARFIYAGMGFTMRDGQREYFYQQLEKEYPGLKEKYERQYGHQYNCPSPKARTLYGVLSSECERLGLLYKMKDIVSDYKMGYEPRQLTFF